MSKVLTIGLLLTLGTTFFVSKKFLNPEYTTKVESNQAVMDLKLPKIENLSSSEETIKLKNSSKTITLEKRNTLVLRGPVTDQSVAKLQQNLQNMSLKLNKNDKIFLVLDTPGGSVFAGLELIDHLRAVPQKIETVTLFAASMGFQIVQNMDKRYISPSGTLMSHRARGGVQGQFDGELETRYRMVKRAIDYLDAIASKRMDISIKEYKRMIKDEYWVQGFDAPSQKAVDEIANILCGKSLTGTEIVEFRTIFGPVDVELSKCPIIRGILGFQFKGRNTADEAKALNLINTAFQSKEEYINDYILTGKHYKVFK